MTRILFVCTGNTCRSPMAEAMLRDMAKQKGIQVEVKSAGVSTVDGLGISANASQALRSRNIDHAGKSRALNSEFITWADLILTMTGNHKRNLLQWYPQAVDKTFTLKEYVVQDTDAYSQVEELERLYSEMHLKQALGQHLTAEERTKLLLLERSVPSFDIEDPFGGTLDRYQRSADEIQVNLELLLQRLEK